MIISVPTAFFDETGRCITILFGGEVDETQYAAHAPAPSGVSPNRLRYVNGEVEIVEPDA